MSKVTYRTYLRGIGRRPIPPVQKLRTDRKPGDVELLPVRGIYTTRPAVTAPGKPGQFAGYCKGAR